MSKNVNAFVAKIYAKDSALDMRVRAPTCVYDRYAVGVADLSNNDHEYT